MNCTFPLFLGLILLLSPLFCWSQARAGNPVLRVESVRKSANGTEVNLQPMLAPQLSAVVETGDLKQGDVIRCNPTTRYTGNDKHGDRHHIIVLKCGDRVLLLKEVNF